MEIGEIAVIFAMNININTMENQRIAIIFVMNVNERNRDF
jgi:hypothetical protein